MNNDLGINLARLLLILCMLYIVLCGIRARAGWKVLSPHEQILRRMEKEASDAKFMFMFVMTTTVLTLLPLLVGSGK